MGLPDGALPVWSVVGGFRHSASQDHRLSPAQRNRSAALKASGYEDGPALTVQSTDGEIPQGRELSFAWLAGTVMTGLTSVLLMGAALYVSFQGQDTFSTAYEALQIVTEEPEAPVDLIAKQDRVRPVTADALRARDDRGLGQAERRGPRPHPHDRVRAHPRDARDRRHRALGERAGLRSSGASSRRRGRSRTTPRSSTPTSTAPRSRARSSIKPAAMPLTLVPPRAISDQTAAEFVRHDGRRRLLRSRARRRCPMPRPRAPRSANSASSTGLADLGRRERLR